MKVHQLIMMLNRCDKEADVFFNANAEANGLFQIDGLLSSVGTVSLLEKLPDWHFEALKAQKEKNEGL